MAEYSKMFFDMHLSIIATDDEVSFITSDAPIFLCIPGIGGQWQHPFLAHEHVEVRHTVMRTKSKWRSTGHSRLHDRLKAAVRGVWNRF